MDNVIPNERVSRDFRANFTDEGDVDEVDIEGRLWLAALRLAAGFNIVNKDNQSNLIRPLAIALVNSLEDMRGLLREQCFEDRPAFTENIRGSFRTIDLLLAEFEFAIVTIVTRVQKLEEYETQQALIVLFSETLQRAVKNGVINQESVDDCDPALMFTIPRLAVVAGLCVFPNGPLCLDDKKGKLVEPFIMFRSDLNKIHLMLEVLGESGLPKLEKLLYDGQDTTDQSSDSVEKRLLDKLFILISGVADKLHSYHVEDVRIILQHVFLINAANSGSQEKK